MVKTASSMLPLGTALPLFDLPVVQGVVVRAASSLAGSKRINSSMVLDKPFLVMMICAHCPYVKHIEPELGKLNHDFGNSLHIIAVSSNSVRTHPQDSPVHLAKQANSNGWDFPYLFDEDQNFAKSLQAACTPDFFLFAPGLDSKQVLKYRGQLDDSRPGNKISLTGNDLREAIEAILHRRPVPDNQKPSLGCNIKWHPGQEPPH